MRTSSSRRSRTSTTSSSSDNEPLTFELHLEVRPEIELARTQGFRVSRTERHVTDEQVREQIDQLRDQRASWAPAEDRPRRATW